MLILFQSNAASHDPGSVIINTETEKFESCNTYKDIVKKGSVPTYFVNYSFTHRCAIESFDDEESARSRLKDILKILLPNELSIDEIVNKIRFFDKDE